ncbi:MAG: family 43 glycosylhydrolase [Thermomicrobiales bacterium]
MDTNPPPAARLRPLFPEEIDQGDPFAFAVPSGVPSRFRHYIYTSGEEPVAGTAFPVYGSDDLTTWLRLDDALEVGLRSAHWAPCVRHVPGSARPFVMLYSRAVGLGAQGHVGHAIRRADAERPEGPFRDSGHVLTPGLDFAIDPDVYRLPDGSLKIAFAMDFTADEPFGTGIVEADIDEDLTALTGPPRLLARARFGWQVYEPARVMPWKTIPGVDRTTETVRWHTLEAPVGGLISPQGKRVYLYSGGCFWGFYAVGALVEDEQGHLQDVTDGVARFVIGPQPDEGVFAPGHCSWLRTNAGQDYLMLHARFDSPTARRQMCLLPLRWSDDGLPFA